MSDDLHRDQGAVVDLLLQLECVLEDLLHQELAHQHLEEHVWPRLHQIKHHLQHPKLPRHHLGDDEELLHHHRI